MTEDEIKFLEEFQKKYLTESPSNTNLQEIYNQFGIDIDPLS